MTKHEIAERLRELLAVAEAKRVAYVEKNIAEGSEMPASAGCAFKMGYLENGIGTIVNCIEPISPGGFSDE